MIKELTRRTKIIWSFESKILTKELAKQVAEEDIAAMRFLYSSQNQNQLIEFILEVKKHRKSKEQRLAIMLDLSTYSQGQVVGLTAPTEFTYGQKLNLIPEDSKASEGLKIRSQDWDGVFQEDKSVFIGYGQVVLKVIAIKKKCIETQVIQGGVLLNDEELHVPETKKNPTIFDLTTIDATPLLSLDIDFIMLPGFTTAREVSLIKRKLATITDKIPWFIGRVDSKGAYESLDEVLSEVDGIMISRRDLSLTMEPAIIPMVCKEIIHECHKRAKLSILASEMLGSMRYNPTPTRAEVSDIANAIMDATDAVVLSEELSLGSFHEKAASLCRSIIEDVEIHEEAESNWKRNDFVLSNEFDAVAFHAVKTAVRVQAKAIVCFTKEGNTALRLASFQVPMPIIAVTFSEAIGRRLCIVRGVSSIVLQGDPHLDDVIPMVNNLLKKESWLKAGDLYVFVTVSISSVGKVASNLFTVQKLD